MIHWPYGYRQMRETRNSIARSKLLPYPSLVWSLLFKLTTITTTTGLETKILELLHMKFLKHISERVKDTVKINMLGKCF